MNHFPPFFSSIFIDLHKIGRVKKVACKEMYIIEMANESAPPHNYSDTFYNEILWAFSCMVATVLGGTEIDVLTSCFDFSPTGTLNVQNDHIAIDINI